MRYNKNKNDNLIPRNLFLHLTEYEKNLLNSGGLNIDIAETMRENVISTIQIPLSFVDDFNVNGKKYFVPMATEEGEVISLAKKGVELINSGGGFNAESTASVMIGQIQVVNIPDQKAAILNILAEKNSLLNDANSVSTTRKALDLQLRTIETTLGSMMIVELLVDVKDSMGANIVDSMCELIAPTIERLSGGRVNMRILSNLATRRMVKIEGKVPHKSLDGQTIEKIIKASAFAEADPYRATTHNKGIMNGISAVLLATGNDTRAVEAGAHAYASLSGAYKPLSLWKVADEGDLLGTLELPMSVGIIGGVVSVHPLAKLCLKILNVSSSATLGQIAGAAGLAANLGALYTLVTTGITSISN